MGRSLNSAKETCHKRRCKNLKKFQQTYISQMDQATICSYAAQYLNVEESQVDEKMAKAYEINVSRLFCFPKIFEHMYQNIQKYTFRCVTRCVTLFLMRTLGLDRLLFLCHLYQHEYRYRL